ncbi:hypothetical protein [Clostridium massiliamazoniense]|uniref:hypothetical protein n=1 Tax=Clostridium massiliamazoniense TaxID=1347366 RepID=UPI0006D7AB2F|nr:hypothetical protein [Clostridium massiliamazoniense]
MGNIKVEFNEDEIIKLKDCIEYVERETRRIKDVINLNEKEEANLEKFMKGLKEMKEKIYKSKNKERREP